MNQIINPKTKHLPKHFNTAYKIALQNKNKTKSRHACILVKGGSVISTATNCSKRTRLVDYYYKEEHYGLHAEARCVAKVRRKIDLNGSKAFVIRLDKNGNITTSKPCNNCQKLLYNYGIKKVFYTINNNTYACMKL